MKSRSVAALGLLAAMGITLALAGCAPATSSAAGSPVTQSSASAATSGNSADTSKEIDACSLLSASDASALVGETLSAGVSSTIAPGQDQCAYDSNGADIGLTVIVYHGNAAPSYALITSAIGATTPVSGVGEKAADNGSIELDVAISDQRVVAVQYEKAAGRLAVAKAVVAALK